MCIVYLRIASQCTCALSSSAASAARFHADAAPSLATSHLTSGSMIASSYSSDEIGPSHAWLASSASAGHSASAWWQRILPTAKSRPSETATLPGWPPCPMAADDVAPIAPGLSASCSSWRRS